MVASVANRGVLGNLISGNKVTGTGVLPGGVASSTKKTTGSGLGRYAESVQAEMDKSWATANSAFTPQELAIQKAISDQTAAILADSDRQAAEFAAQPKFIYRDTNAAWQNAQNTAASSVNPVYVDRMNQFLLEQKNYLSQTKAEIGAQKGALDTSLTQTNEDIATNKARTTEDTATTIAQNKLNEGNWQTTEGAEAYQQEEQARLALGDQGTMGRGAGQLGEAKITRNQASGVQTKAFDQERVTANLLKTRTFADLATKGKRAKQYTTTEKKNLDRQLSDYIVNQGTDLTEFKSSNESARLDALYSATDSQYKTDTANWLSTLGSQGYRPQDIGLATSNYGR